MLNTRQDLSSEMRVSIEVRNVLREPPKLEDLGTIFLGTEEHQLHYDPVASIEELVEKAGSYKTLKKTLKNSQGKKKVEYIDLVCAFDIETSSFISPLGVKHACMYCWQLALNGYVYFARTWQEFMYAMGYIVDYYQLNENRRMKIWVHNLAYEFAWIAYRFNWIECFAREKMSPMRACTDKGLEFCCSYILSGCSLELVGKNLQKYKVRKLVGALDYSQIRGPETFMKPREIDYCINDVLVVTAYIWEQIEIYKKMTNIPMTNTGRVRTHIRKKCLSKEYYKSFKHYVKGTKITGAKEYKMLKRAFQGGFTHSNYHLCEDTLWNVASFDLTSSYPTVMVAFRFPCGTGKLIKRPTEEYINEHKADKCFVFNCTLHNVRPKEDGDYEHPISTSKCFTCDDGPSKIGSDNNGRVRNAEIIYTTITDVDLEIYRDFYDFDLEIGDCFEYPKAYLPKPIVEAIIELYEDKSTLKYVPDKQAEYLLKKGMLNSCYGMICMDIVQEEVWFDASGWRAQLDLDESEQKGAKKRREFTDEEINEALNKYNEDTYRFTFYPVGVFVTAYARRNLFYAIKEMGADHCYSDTDSEKFLNLEKHKDFFDRYNKWITERIETALKFHGIDPKRACPIVTDDKGNQIECPLGVWDFEGVYRRFKTLGAKRYLTEKRTKEYDKYANAELYCGAPEYEVSATIAGVSKKGAKRFLNYHTEDPFETFSDDLEIDSEFSGKTQMTYLDRPYQGTIKDYQGNEFHYEELSGAHMSVSNYHLSLSDTFAELLGARTQQIL